MTDLMLKKLKVHIQELSTQLVVLDSNHDLFSLFNGVSSIVASILSRQADRAIPVLTGVNQRKRMLSFYSKLIKKGDLCFDIGAHVGSFSKVLLELGARVVCVEPQESCLRQLNNLFANNKNVVIVPKAVGEYEGEGELMINDEHEGLSTMSGKEYINNYPDRSTNWTKSARVSMTTLDNLISLYGSPKYCKIDVEGFEAQVLHGLSKPIDIISFEFHKWYFNEAVACIDYLSRRDKVEFNCMYGDSMKFLFLNWLSAKDLRKKIDDVSYMDSSFWGDIYARRIV